MDKQYLALNGALFFWLLALIAWSVNAIVPARLAAACALVAFLLHSQRNKINAMFNGTPDFRSGHASGK